MTISAESACMSTTTGASTSACISTTTGASATTGALFNFFLKFEIVETFIAAYDNNTSPEYTELEDRIETRVRKNK